MKKKIIPIIAIAISVIFAFGFIGCGGSITVKDFNTQVSNVVKNYSSKNLDYETCEDFEITYETLTSNGLNEKMYVRETVDDEIKNTTVDSQLQKETIKQTVSVKRIDGELFVNIYLVEVRDNYEKCMLPDDTLGVSGSIYEEVTRYDFGVHKGQFYLRKSAYSKQFNYETAQTYNNYQQISYRLYNNKQDYVIAVNGILQEIFEDLLVYSINQFTMPSQYASIAKYSSDKDNVSVMFDLGLVEFDTYDLYTEIRETAELTYGKGYPIEFYGLSVVENVYDTERSYKQSSTATIRFNQNSTINPLSSPFIGSYEGYVSDSGLIIPINFEFETIS